MKSIIDLLNKINEEGEPGKTSLDFLYNDLLQFLPFNIAKDYLSKETTAEEWEMYYRPLKKGNVIGLMESYMSTAWDSCLNKRPTSSSTSLAHYKTWLWILEDQESIDYLNIEENYTCFGAPILKYICDRYGWNLTTFIEEWEREHAQQFIQGKGCQMAEFQEHPCAPCVSFVERKNHNLTYPFPVCVNRERLAGMTRSWTATNRKGPKCKEYLYGTQTRLAPIEEIGGDKKNE